MRRQHHPLCAEAKVASHSLIGADAPPSKGGDKPLYYSRKMLRYLGFGETGVVMALLPILLLSCGAIWQSDTNRAIEQERTGEYKAAADVLEPAVQGGNNDPQVVESLYYAWVRQGEYAKAREKFEAWAAARPNAGPIRLAAGRINRITGNYTAALNHLNAIQTFAGLSTAAQLEKAKVLDETGKRGEAQDLYKRILDAYQNGALRSASDLFSAAQAMWATEYFHDANDTLKVVTKMDPRNAEAFVVWGDLLLDKYNQPEAIDSYNDALKIDGKLPEAQLGLARAFSLAIRKKLKSRSMPRWLSIRAIPKLTC